MPLPAGVVVGTVVGEFLDDEGTARTGEVRFTPLLNPLPFASTTPPVIIVNDGAVGVLDSAGRFSVDLIATEDRFYYRVEPRISGQALTSYLIQVEAGEQDLATLVPVIPPDTPGLPGAQGPAGLSAYQVALANGYVGTQAQWLASLVGAAGEDGAPGTPGAPGADGVANIEPVAVLPPLEEQEPGVFYVVTG
jgi:hypothetical protein